MEQGIARDLDDGISTRIFPGKQAMLSVVRIAPTLLAPFIATPKNNGA